MLYVDVDPAANKYIRIDVKKPSSVYRMFVDMPKFIPAEDPRNETNPRLYSTYKLRAVAHRKVAIVLTTAVAVAQIMVATTVALTMAEVQAAREAIIQEAVTIIHHLLQEQYWLLMLLIQDEQF